MRKVVTVVWGDAHSNNNELTEAEILSIHRPTIVKTTGHIIKSDEVGVSIVGEHLPAMRGDEYDSFRSHTFIPRAMVISEGVKKRVRRNGNVNRADGGVASPSPVPVVAESRMPRSEMSEKGETK